MASLVSSTGAGWIATGSGQFLATPIFGLPPADKWTSRKLYVYIAPTIKWRSENKRLSQNV